MKHMDIFKQLANFSKEWAPLIISFIGILISAWTAKLANRNFFLKKNSILRKEEMEANDAKKKEMTTIYKEMSIRLERYLNENTAISKSIVDKEVELLNKLFHNGQLAPSEIHESLNLFFTKKVLDIRYKHSQFNKYISLTKAEMNNPNDLFFQCTKCNVLYWENRSDFLFDLMNDTQDKLWLNRKKYESKNITPSEYDKEFTPFIYLLQNVTEIMTNNFLKVSVSENESIKIDLDLCQCCQKYSIDIWWFVTYPNVDFPQLKKLLNRES